MLDTNYKGSICVDTNHNRLICWIQTIKDQYVLIQTITDQYVGYKPAVFGGECTGYISIRGGYRKSKQKRFKIQRYKLNDKKHDELKKLWIFFNPTC